MGLEIDVIYTTLQQVEIHEVVGLDGDESDDEIADLADAETDNYKVVRSPSKRSALVVIWPEDEEEEDEDDDGADEDGWLA